MAAQSPAKKLKTQNVVIHFLCDFQSKDLKKIT